MHLINNSTLTLEWFMGKLPPYAILSHTWEDEEVTFQDFCDPDHAVRLSKKGFSKIQKTCRLASELGLRYSWVDTCCIDKKSSAELTEAINSMFQWYQAAEVCFVWLADLPSLSSPGPTSHKQSSSGNITIPNLGRCRWFSRGWTLQELLAPGRVEFYDQAWKFRGTKIDLAKQLTQITNIGEDVLRSPSIMQQLSIAQRMAWAAGRQTTRVEDMAYCLLGVFGVNMSMMYGEGTRAFIRLQEMIAAQSNDFSLFAWREHTNPEGQAQIYRGVFALSPNDFSGSASVQLMGNPAYNPEFLLTNKGLRMTPSIFAGADGAYFLGLNCVDTAHRRPKEEIGIWIQAHGAGVYSRVKSSEYAFRPPSDQAPKIIRIFLSRTITVETSRQLEGSTDHAFILRKGFNEANIGKSHAPDFPFEAIQILPNEQWDSERHMFVTQGASDFVAYAYFMVRYECEIFKTYELSSSESFFLAFGRKLSEGAPWVCISSLSETPALQLAMGDARKVAVAVSSMKEKRMTILRDAYNWISKAIHVSLETATEGSRIIYYIDLELRDAPDKDLKGEEGALSHPESYLYKKRNKLR
jgi:hypothetical protein